MKINLTLNNEDITDNTYTNVDKSSDLDTICEDAECEHILALDVIDYLSSKDLDETIETWVAKLRHGGKITIGGTDLGGVAKALTNKQLNLIEANILLFGNQQEPWQFKQSGLTAYELAKALQGCGLKIIKNRTHNYQYVVEAERP